MPTSNQVLKFRVFGMDCAEEVTLLKREIGPLVGGEARLSFDVLSGKMTVSEPPADVDVLTIVKAVEGLGLGAEPWSDDPSSSDPKRNTQSRLRTALVVGSGTGAFLAFCLHIVLAGSVRAALGNEGLGSTETVPLVSRILYGFSVLTGVWLVIPKAYLAFRRMRPDINLLMIVAVTGAVAIGEWFEAATVSFLFACSALLESWSVSRARKAIGALLDLAPTTVRVLSEAGQESEVVLNEVTVGMTFTVRPGESIPLDGRVVKGASDVNQAPITGESKPIDKAVGDPVFAGTVNGNGALEVISTAKASDTKLANIIRLVEDAQSRRAPAEQWVEAFSRIYTPIVMGIAVLMLVVPPLVFAQTWHASIYNALVMLVIACPCALVISTPVSIVAGLTAAARRGVLIKGGMYLEIPSRLNAIAFDKTGTLTQGTPEVVHVEPLNNHTPNEVVARAAALESNSDHPLAHAIVEYAKRQNVQPMKAEDLQTVQGKGVVATIDGRRFWLGSHRYLEERGQETPEVHERLQTLSSDGRTVVVIGNDDHVCGFLGLADSTRSEAPKALQTLRDLNVKHLVMLTGDNRPTAEAIARKVGVDEIHAELLPEDKVGRIEQLVEKYGTVAMLGDGINDAPALARATLGIAMGAIGSDAALETADIVLMSDDLAQLPWLLRHSRRTLAIIRQNIFLSLAIKVLFVVLIFFDIASLWAAIAGDMGTSFVVIANSLRLLNRESTNADEGGSGMAELTKSSS